MGACRVVVADDSVLIRAGIRHYLADTASFDVVAETDNSDALLSVCGEVRPHIVIVQPNLPCLGGYEIARRLRAGDAYVKLALLSRSLNPSVIAAATKCGFNSVLTQRIELADLLRELQRLAQDGPPTPPTETVYSIESVVATDDDPLERLSVRELEVFRRLADGESVDNIADSLRLSPKTVGHRYTQVKRKLGTENRAQLTLSAIRLGLIPV